MNESHIEGIISDSLNAMRDIALDIEAIGEKSLVELDAKTSDKTKSKKEREAIEKAKKAEKIKKEIEESAGDSNSQQNTKDGGGS